MVTLRPALAATHTVCFDLLRVGCHPEAGNGCVFGLPGAMRDDLGVAVLPGKRDGFEGFAERTDLVDFARMVLATCSLMPWASWIGLFTNRSSPTSYTPFA